jgi:hypothetical protein
MSAPATCMLPYPASGRPDTESSDVRVVSVAERESIQFVPPGEWLSWGEGAMLLPVDWHGACLLTRYKSPMG